MMQEYSTDAAEEHVPRNSNDSGHLDSDNDISTVTLNGDDSTEGASVANDIGGSTGLSAEKIRLTRTLSMTLLYVTMGLCTGIISPCILDLMELYRCSLEQLSLMMTSKQVGLLIGSFAGGFVTNRIRDKVHLVLAVAGFVIVLANTSIPWCRHLWLAGIAVSLTGISHGTINVVCSSVTMSEWAERAPSAVNLLHFSFSLGMFLSPLTVAPFLSKTANNATLTTTSLPYSLALSYDESLLEARNSSSERKTKIFIPFAFQGIPGIVGGFLFLGYYLVGWRHDSSDGSGDGGDDSSTAASGRWQTFRIVMAVGIYLAYVGIVVQAASVNNFIVYVGVKGPLALSKSRAVILNTANNGSIVFGRLLGTILASLVRVHVLVFGSISAVLGLTVLLVVFAFGSEPIFWILVCAASLFAGPCYASVMAWADRYTEMDGVMVAIVDVGIASGAAFALYVGAYVIHHNGPIYAFVLSASGAASLMTVMVILQIVCCNRRQRFTNQVTTVNAINASAGESRQIEEDSERLLR